MRTTQRSLASAAACALLCLYGAGPARATIVDCQPVPGAFTVFLSEPSFSPSVFQNREQMLAFMQRLQFELDQGREGRWVHSPATEVRFVTCINRVPALDGQEFVPALIEGLHSNRVLLEIWGQLDAAPGQPGSARLSAQMNYLLVPVQFAKNQRERVPTALQRLLYPDQSAGPAPDFVQLIARPLDIDAFVAAAFGFKLLRERNHELAHKNLCRASALLHRIEERTLPPRPRRDVAALRAFVRESAARAITEARAAGRQGTLQLLSPQEPCGREEQP